MQHRIIDNSTEENSLLNRLKSYIPVSQSLKIATGYFFIRGFNQLIEDLGKLENIEIIIGNSSNKETIEEIALGYKYLDDAAEEIENKNQKLTKRAKEPLIQTTKNDVRMSIETVEITDESEITLKRLADFIEQKKLKFKVYLKNKLHSKAYIFDYKKQLFDDSGKPINIVEDGVAIVGSSNFTLAGLTHNTELNVLIEGKGEHDYLTKWFEKLWDESEDFSEHILNEINNSWAKNYPTPYEIYLKILYNLVKDRLEDSDELILGDSDIFIDLAKFQKRAVALAINILEKYNGVFISDVVGLGKSFIGSALIDYYHKKGKRALIICPPRLLPMWQSYNNVYDLGAEIISMGELSQSDGVSRLKKYIDKEIILIDESHNFRNNENNRYRNLSEFLLPYDKKLILMSATPQNNSPMDIYNQIKLFHHEDETDIPITPANLKEFINLAIEKKVNLQSMLEHLLIRRTRAHIKKYYPDEKINGKPIVFPKRNIPEPINYSIENVYSNMYSEILDDLGSLKYARYNLFSYVKSEFKEKSPYRELQSAGKNLRGFVKVLLLKRIESSVEAFRKTIETMIRIHEIYLEAIQNLKLLPIGDKAQSFIYGTDEYLDNEIDFTGELEKIIESHHEQYEINAFKIESLKEDLLNDLNVFKKIMGIISNITAKNDDKLNQLKKKIKEIKLNNEKILIFSQFTDTTKYIYENLKDDFRDEIAEVSSETSNLISIVKRFAPKANDGDESDFNNQINILISSDVLSEGQNLQDCNVVINYDIHWNPVRLIQRVGRVDRIGSEQDEIFIYNFLPEAKLEEKLGIRERVSKRIQEIHNVFGEDGKYLDDNEILNTNDMYAIYDERDENIFDEKEFIVSEAEGIIRQLQDNNPELFEKIKNMQDGVRCIRRSNENKYVILCRLGKHYSFYITNDKGEILSQNEDEAIKLVKAEPNEIGLSNVPEGANKIISDTFNIFRKRMKESQLNKDKKFKSRTREQDYIIKELESLLTNLNEYTQDYEQRKITISNLLRIFSSIIPTGINKHLRIFYRRKLSGDELISELVRIVNEFDLLRERKNIEEDRREIPKMICGEIFVK